MARRRIVAFSLVAAVVIGAPALGFTVQLGNETSGPLVRWPSPTLRFKLNPACSADLPSTQCLAAVRDSFAEWTGHACSSIAFQEDTSAWTNTQLQLTAFGYENGKNELAWIEDSRWVYGEFVLGITAPYYIPQTGEITEADIIFNGYQQTWQLDGEDWSTDVKNVAVHEIGHLFGLQHVLYGYSSSNPPTMAPEADPYMKSRTPEADDLKGLCFLYPAGAYACQSNADCPNLLGEGPNGERYVGQLTCDANHKCGGISNDIPQGTAQLGEDCVGSGDCVDGMTCYPVSATGGVCASDCATNPDSCPTDYECIPYEDDPTTGLCFHETPAPQKTLGQPCSESTECLSNLCAPEAGGPRCRQPCTGPGSCPSGQTCQPIPGSEIGACVQSDVEPEKKANGQACDSGDECESGLCAGSGVTFLCTQSCTSGNCPAGYACLPLGGGAAGCFATEDKGVGEACDSGLDCASGLCFEGENNTGWCSGQCENTAQCPCGMECVETQYYDENDQLVTDQLCNLGAPVGCLPLGTTCNDDDECAGGACYRGVCEQACSAVLAGGGCPSGQGCARREPPAIDGVCGPVGANPVGSPCGQDNACASSFCYGNLCATACNPFASNTCEAGLVCLATPENGQLGVCSDPPAVVEPEADAGPNPTDDSGAETVPTSNPTTEPTITSEADASSGSDLVTTTPRHRESGCTGSGATSFAALLVLVGLSGLRRRSTHRARS